MRLVNKNVFMKLYILDREELEMLSFPAAKGEGERQSGPEFTGSTVKLLSGTSEGNSPSGVYVISHSNHLTLSKGGYMVNLGGPD